MSFYDKDKLEKTQVKIRESISSAQSKILQEADAAFAEVAEEFDKRQEMENALRVWAKNITEIQLDFTEIEELRDVCKKAPFGIISYNARRGRVHVYKTLFGTIDRMENYISVLERTIIDVTNNSQFTTLGFRDLIKLAFKRLFKRSK
jgi:hypothetical protein